MNASFQPYEGQEPYIFVSYSHDDIVRVRPLLEVLRRSGYRLWYDRGIQPGIRWANDIAEHIARCAVFMPLISSAFADSVFCHDETMYALKKERIVVPVYLEDVELPCGLEMRLHAIQWRRLSDYSDMTDFAISLDKESVFDLCKDRLEWHEDGGIRWSLRDGVLKIVKKTLDDMPDYSKKTAAPWKEYAEDIELAEIARGVSRIGSYAFYQRYNLRKVTIPDSVTEIKDAAFEECGMLTGVLIPNSVTKIGLWAFYHCERLSSVTLSDCVHEISAATFEGCHSLAYLKIPNGVTIVGKWAFYDCASLTGVTIPDSVIAIAPKAFGDCPSLMRVCVPSNANIAPDAFDSYTQITTKTEESA